MTTKPDTAPDFAGVDIPTMELAEGDVFLRHGRVWVALAVTWTGPYSSIHVSTDGGGDVWMSRQGTVRVVRRGAQVDLRK